jgi:hypothetical protein
MNEIVMGDTLIHNSIIFQLDVIGEFLQASTRSRVFIVLPKKYGYFIPALKDYCENQFY